MQKLYCYIDESGAGAKGEPFIVSVIIAQSDRETLIGILEKIEQKSGKGTLKWAKAKDARRVAYIRAVFQNSAFKEKLYYAVYTNTQEYIECTVTATAEAIIYCVEEEKYKADVLFDGLRDNERDAFAAAIRDRGIRTGKVRGVDDERNVLIRLADALCGFLRDALESRPGFDQMMDNAIRDGYLIQIEE